MANAHGAHLSSTNRGAQRAGLGIDASAGRHTELWTHVRQKHGSGAGGLVVFRAIGLTVLALGRGPHWGAREGSLRHYRIFRPRRADELRPGFALPFFGKKTRLTAAYGRHYIVTSWQRMLSAFRIQ